MSISPISEIVSELSAGRMVILVDEEDRENEGDLVLAADFVTPEAINFMVTYARGLVCLTLTEARCKQLGLKQMSNDNNSQFSTAFTTSIEAAEGVTTGISAHDRAKTIQAAVARDAVPEDIVQPGHIFPIMAREGGVLIRAGHTEAGCDLPQMAGLTPSSVICEIMNDDGSMARLPDLIAFAKKHNLKIGTIADLIHYRSRNESIIERVSERTIQTFQGSFNAIAFRDKPSGSAHLALVHGDIDPENVTLVRVHQPVSILDLLETQESLHSWSVPTAMAEIKASDSGVVLFLNCEETPDEIFRTFSALDTQSPEAKSKLASRDLRTYGIGAQILKSVGVRKMKLLANPRKMPSMTGFDLDVVGFHEQPSQ